MHYLAFALEGISAFGVISIEVLIFFFYFHLFSSHNSNTLKHDLFDFPLFLGIQRWLGALMD